MKIPDYKHKSLDISSLANQLTPYQSLNRCAWLNTGENKSEPVGLFKTQVVLMAKETKSFFNSIVSRPVLSLPAGDLGSFESHSFIPDLIGL